MASSVESHLHPVLQQSQRQLQPEQQLNQSATRPASCNSVQSKADVAATKIQAHVRRRKATLTAQFAKASSTLSHIESINESDQLDSNISVARTVAFLDNEIQSVMGGEDVSPKSRSLSSKATFAYSPTPRPSGETPSFCLPTTLEPLKPTQLPGPTDDGVPKVEFMAGSEGPRVSQDSVNAVLKHLKQVDPKPLPFECMKELVLKMTDLLRVEVRTALIHISTPPPPGQLVLLGDTHGQLKDVLWMFFKYGEPSASNVYLFNGDIADRGPCATEILALVMLFKLWMPGCMHINRGNHEDRTMNAAYGFLTECVNKWGLDQGGELFDLFNQMFNNLPLFSVIDSEVFVVHGGLWRRPPYELALLERLDFRRPIPDPTSGLAPDLLMFDSMWSDPQATKGFSTNPRGQSILVWGPDVTAWFLKRNNLRLLVRSHQLPPGGRGYAYCHSYTCLTVFSASDYCGQCGNLGAVMIMMQGEEDRLEEHWAPTIEEMMTLEADADRARARIKGQARSLALQRTSLRHACKQMEKEVLKRVQELIVKHKAALFEHWSLVDTSPPGLFSIPPATWREGCAAVVDEALPWKHLQEVMGVVNANGDVNYVQFLTRYRIAFEASYGMSVAGWERSVWSKIMETLLRADLSLREALAALDPTNNGLVSPGEFGKLLESCGIDISAMQARSLLRSFSTSGSPAGAKDKPAGEMRRSNGGIWEVSLWQVLTRLQGSLLITPAYDAMDPGLAEWALPKLQKIAPIVQDDSWRRLAGSDAQPEEWPAARLIAVWFEDADTSESGFLQPDDLVEALLKLAPSLQKVGVPTDRTSLARLLKYVDTDGNGRINIFEMFNGFTSECSLGEDFQQDVLEPINAAIYFNIAPIRSALLHFDPDHRGQVSNQDFINALMAVQSALSAGLNGTNALTRLQIAAIADSVERSGDGRIHYEKFLGSFRIVDTVD